MPVLSFAIILPMLKSAGSCRGGNSCERLHHPRHVGLGRDDGPGMVEQPVVVGVRGDVRPLVRVGPQVEDLRHPQHRVRLGPDVERAAGALLQEDELPVVVAQRRQVTVVGDVEEVLARTGVGAAGDVVELVVAVQVHLVRRAGQVGPCLEPVGDVGVTRSGEERHEPVVVGHDAVQDRARGDVAGPTDHRRHPVGTLPVGVLLVAERRHPGVRPAVHVRPVVRGVHDDRVVGETLGVEECQHVADQLVVVDHDVVVLRLPPAGLAAAAVLGVGAEVHVRGVEPHEERGVGRPGVAHEPECLGHHLVVDRLHPLLGQRPGVLDALGAVRRWPRRGSRRGGRSSCGSQGTPPRSGSRRAPAPPRR